MSRSRVRVRGESGGVICVPLTHHCTRAHTLGNHARSRWKRAGTFFFSNRVPARRTGCASQNIRLIPRAVALSRELSVKASRSAYPLAAFFTPDSVTLLSARGIDGASVPRLKFCATPLARVRAPQRRSEPKKRVISRSPRLRVESHAGCKYLFRWASWYGC